MRRLALATALLWACNEPGNTNGLDGSRSADMAMNFGEDPDLATEPAADLLIEEDLAPPPDLSLPPLQALSFGKPATVPAAAWPSALAAADFNLDGRVDLAVAAIQGNEITMLLGKGDGTFRAGVAIPIKVPNALGVGDFNSDHWPDLAILPSGVLGVFVALGRGDGTFEAPVKYVLGDSGVALQVGDFDGDHRSDVAVSEVVQGNPEVLLSKPDGTLKPFVRTKVDWGCRLNLAAGDIDPDGRDDLVCPGDQHTTVLFSNGDGTFAAPLVMSEPSVEEPARVVDIDADGRPDLVRLDGNRNLLVYRNGGKRTFGKLETFPISFATGLGAADFNRDGYPDLVVVEYGGVVRVLRNQNGQSFAASLDYPVEMHAQSPAIADFNNDGKLDLAVPHRSPDLVSVLLNTSH